MPVAGYPRSRYTLSAPLPTSSNTKIAAEELSVPADGGSNAALGTGELESDEMAETSLPRRGGEEEVMNAEEGDSCLTTFSIAVYLVKVHKLPGPNQVVIRDGVETHKW